MNKKISLGVCISLAAICCAVTFVLTMTLSLNMYNEKIAGVQEREEIYTKLQEIDSYVRNNYPGAIDKDTLLLEILNGYMNGIPDSYAAYHTQNEYYELTQTQKGKVITTGMRVEREESGYIKVVEVLENSSASARGVEAGDIITAVDGTAVLDIGAEQGIKLLSGDEGTRITVKFMRSGEEYSQTLIRQQVELKTVRSGMVEQHGYISVSGFNGLTGTQFGEALDTLLQNEIRGLVIDLRGASGMMAQPMKQICSRLVPSTVVAMAEYKNGTLSTLVQTEESDGFALPVVVLVDGTTEMGGELLAAVLKDFKAAQIVGVTTAGNPTLLNTQSLRDGSAVTLTVAKLSSAGGTSFDGEGIRPDFQIEVNGSAVTNPDDSAFQNDLQVKKAFEVLSTLLQ